MKCEMKWEMCLLMPSPSDYSSHVFRDCITKVLVISVYELYGTTFIVTQIVVQFDLPQHYEPRTRIPMPSLPFSSTSYGSVFISCCTTGSLNFRPMKRLHWLTVFFKFVTICERKERSTEQFRQCNVRAGGTSPLPTCKR